MSYLETDIIKLLNNNKIDSVIMAKYIIYVITGNLESVYNGELETLIDRYYDTKDYVELEYFIGRLFKKQVIKAELDHFVIPIPNFKLISHNGLNSIVDFLDSLLQPFNYKKSDILLDLCVEETFRNSEVYKLLSVVPYIINWYGFIYNCSYLFSNEAFISSLSCCKGLFVFSKELKNKIDYELYKRGLTKVIVSCLCLPTNEPKMLFSGPVRGIVSCTTSLSETNSFLFYKNTFKIKQSFFFKKSEIRSLKKTIIGDNASQKPMIDTINNINNSLKLNNWSIGLLIYINKTIHSVDEFDIKSNERSEDLDNILSENIVFCYIVSGTVVEIINECIVRCTPIVINKHPISLELLGPDYPLYYNSETDIILTEKNIKNAHLYLKKINKMKFNKTTFVCTLSSLIN
jgi:hypothetical protein